MQSAYISLAKECQKVRVAINTITLSVHSTLDRGGNNYFKSLSKLHELQSSLSFKR